MGMNMLICLLYLKNLAAPIGRDLRQDLSASSFRSERLYLSSSTSLKVEDKSSRYGECAFYYSSIPMSVSSSFKFNIRCWTFIFIKSLWKIANLIERFCLYFHPLHILPRPRIDLDGLPLFDKRRHLQNITCFHCSWF